MADSWSAYSTGDEDEQILESLLTLNLKQA
jgi:hypothetical protein